MFVKRASIFAIALSILMTGAPIQSKTSDDYLYVREMVEHDIRFISGGVGVNERQALKKRCSDFNLQLVFAVKSGKYLAGIQVDIYGPADEQLVSAVADGPWFIADVPPGDYRVVVSRDRLEKTRSVHVGERRETVMFHWKD